MNLRWTSLASALCTIVLPGCIAAVDVGNTPQESQGEGMTTGPSSAGNPSQPIESDSSEESEGSSGLGSSGSTPDDSSDSDDASGSGGAVACPDNPNFTCLEPLDCDETACGGPLSPRDESGCVREYCPDGTCADGFTCVRVSDWGGCLSSDPITCSESDGACECSGGVTADCGGSLCIPDAQAPVDCSIYQDAQSCQEVAGCGYVTVLPIVDDSGLQYACEEPQSECVFFPAGQGGDDAMTMYWRYTSPTEDFPTAHAVFPASYDVAPLGWLACDAAGTDVCDWWTGSCS